MPLFKRKKNEERMLADGDGHVSWLQLQGYSGGAYTGRNAEAIAAVTSCVDLIATTIASLTPAIKRDGRTASDHILQPLLHNPYRDLSWHDFVVLMTWSKLIYGNAVAVMRSGGSRVTLQYIPWTNVTWFATTQNLIDRYKITDPVSNKIEMFSTDEVLHWRSMAGSVDGLTGRSLVQRCAAVLNLTGTLDHSVEQYFKQGCAPSGLFTIKSNLTEEQRKQLQQSFGESYTGSVNRGKPLLLSGDATYTPVGNTANDAQLVELRRFQLQQIALIFRIPFFYLIDGTTTFASAKEATRALHASLQSHISSLTSAFSVKFLQPNERLVLDQSEHLKPEAKARYEQHKIAIDAGIYTPEEAREMENIEGELS